MLRLEDVHKTYRQGPQIVHALRGVTLHIEKPGFFAIMGPSGSGKSTLLHLMAGLDRPTSGDVLINGENLARLSEARLTLFRRRQVGIVFQQFNLIATLTARQNVALPAVIDRRPRKWINQRVDQLLDQLGISARAEHRPEALSGGEQQRVAIARALLFDPPLLLADEPTGNLDAVSSDRLWNLLGDIARTQNITVIMVTHEPAAAAHCEHVYVLGDGLLKGDFAVENHNVSDVATRYQQLGR